MKAIKDINKQESEVKLRRCCRYTPEVFRDTKTEQVHPQDMWVVACSSCGKFSDHLDREQAVWKWNEGFTERNPIDRDLVRRLENGRL